MVEEMSYDDSVEDKIMGFCEKKGFEIADYACLSIACNNKVLELSDEVDEDEFDLDDDELDLDEPEVNKPLPKRVIKYPVKPEPEPVDDDEPEVDIGFDEDAEGDEPELVESKPLPKLKKVNLVG